ncbi:MAG TPA: GH92 family glycosyl hydrolase [Puia sp.]|nr:GH92 family glycosyl hydrolase [Puia sp.]
MLIFFYRRHFFGTLVLAGVFSLPMFASLPVYAQQKGPLDYVNPFIGASTSVVSAKSSGGLGKTFPGATTPFGMVQVSPNTITGGDNGSGYSYEHKTIEGFALTQMSGVGWYGDLGNFLVMPTTGMLKTNPGKEGGQDGYRSYYDKKSEKASPGYYAVELTDHSIRAEVTATPHCGLMRFIFPASRQSRIQIDLARRVGGTSGWQSVKVVDPYTIEGSMKCSPEGGGWGNGSGHADYTVFFYARFSKPLKNYGVWSATLPDDWKIKLEEVGSQRYQDSLAHATVTRGVKEKKGRHIGFFTEFATGDGEAVLLKAGISFVDLAGARANLEKEIGDSWDFEKIHQQAREGWEKALSKISVKGGSEEERTSFYTALYHTLIDPRTFQDVNGNYPGGDHQAHRAEGYVKRTIFSGWDVFRSQMPLQTLINPRVVNDMIRSWISLATENGTHYFDRWEFLNAYSGCMVGNPSLSVIADAYAKDIRDYDVGKAYQYSVNTALKFGNGDKGYSGGENSISNTLEYAYSDWCLSRLAAELGQGATATKYRERGQAYKKVFDPGKGWFRPLKGDGQWEAWPAEGRLTEGYGTVESNPYQQGWFVPQDIPGMVQLMGGREKVLADLTDFFQQTPDDMLWNKYYNHANEPVHHVAFLFNRLGAPWLTQQWTRATCRRAYHNSVEGLVGNEDVGQMSAWYVLAASGLHPVCPGETRFEITSPVFEEVNIAVGHIGGQGHPGAGGSAVAGSSGGRATADAGRIFTIRARNNSSENIYIQAATLNGHAYNRCWLDYKDLAAGGVLELTMGPEPNRHWGVGE